MRKKKYDIFISYRRRCSSDKAEMLWMIVEEMGYRGRVSFDRENLDGRFNVALISRIDSCRDYLMFVAPGTFDRIDPDDQEATQLYSSLAAMPEKEFAQNISELSNQPLDYVRIELARALHRAKTDKKLNIIPIIPEDSPEFSFAKLNLPPDIAAIKEYHGVSYSNSVVGRLKQITPDLKRRLKSPRHSLAMPSTLTAIALVLALAGIGIWKYQKEQSFLSQDLTYAQLSQAKDKSFWFIGDKVNAKYQTIDSLFKSDTKIGLQPNWSLDITERQLKALLKMLDDMAYIEGGTFHLGAAVATDNVYPRFEMPQTEQNVAPFYIQKWEATMGEWASVMGGNVPTDSTDFPIANITFDESKLFAEKLFELTGLPFALPSEIEWEYAAKGGPKANENWDYSGGDDPMALAWHAENSNGKPYAKRSIFDNHYPNQLDLFNMSGNLAEWCDNEMWWYADGSTYGDSLMVVRGGSFDSPIHDITVTHRAFMPHQKSAPNVGCRLIIREI